MLSKLIALIIPTWAYIWNYQLSTLLTTNLHFLKCIYLKICIKNGIFVMWSAANIDTLVEIYRIRTNKGLGNKVNTVYLLASY